MAVPVGIQARMRTIESHLDTTGPEFKANRR